MPPGKNGKSSSNVKTWFMNWSRKMDLTYWQKQTPAKPLFPDLLWSRPENRAQAGKLLIVGGNKFGFAAAGEAYAEAEKAGIGRARVLLPDSLQKTVGKVFDAGEYAPSTPSGSFSQKALAELLSLSQWADGVLLAGDFGRNSETAILLEKFLTKYDGQLTITHDAADYFTKTPAVLNRSNTLPVLSFAQLQKLAVSAGFSTAFTFDMALLQLAEALHNFTRQYSASIIIKHLDNILVAVAGQVTTTKLTHDQPIWRVQTAAHAAVWWIQNPDKAFEALTSSLVKAV
jgi:NAD(P)H-hydrate repair Nnr-like enzyme with NAD(P)H-hydrate dehydratase domain